MRNSEGPVIIVAGPTSGKDVLIGMAAEKGKLLLDTDSLLYGPFKTYLTNKLWKGASKKGGDKSLSLPYQELLKMYDSAKSYGSFLALRYAADTMDDSVPTILTNLWGPSMDVAFRSGTASSSDFHFRKDADDLGDLLARRGQDKTEMVMLAKKWIASTSEHGKASHKSLIWLSEGEYLSDKVLPPDLGLSGDDWSDLLSMHPAEHWGLIGHKIIVGMGWILENQPDVAFFYGLTVKLCLQAYGKSKAH